MEKHVNSNPNPAATAATARGWRAALAACALALLANCGGGSLDQAFVPTRFVAFGDEQSALIAGGRRHGVNDAGGDCIQYETWTQYVARVYGYYFAECPGSAAASRVMADSMRAAPQARVAQVEAQVEAYLAAPAGVSTSHLALFMAGTWDVIDLYLQVRNGGSYEAARAEATDRGRRLAVQINRVALAGPAVINVTIPNLIYTPWGRAQAASAPNFQGALEQLSRDFNTGLRVNQINNGRLIGYVDFEGEIQQIVGNPGRFGYGNGLTAICSQSSVSTTAPAATPLVQAQDSNLPNCTTSTLEPGNTLTSLSQTVWAGALTFTPAVHQRLGLLVQQRVANNPF
jgi:hypothetical protein